MIVTDQYQPMIGGVPTVTRNLAINIARRGHQVWLVTSSAGLRNTDYIEQKVHVFRFSSFEWPLYKGLRIPFFPFLISMHRLIRSIDPDILHVHAPIVVGKMARYMAYNMHIPVIATNHFLPIYLSNSIVSKLRLDTYFNNHFYKFFISFYNKCTHVTAPTTTALNLLYERGLHVPSSTISNGIDLHKFTPGDCDNYIRKYLHLPQDRPLVLLVNRLSKEKRIDVLLNAAAKMRGNGYIALVGTGPAEAALRSQADRLQLGNRVSFLGFVNEADLLALRSASDVFVIASEAELQSLATMEAMACGLPVIAANACALPELVHHGKNGFLFECGNSSMLAHYLDLLLADTGLRARMKVESLKIIAQHDHLSVIDQWESLYEGCAARNHDER